MLGVQPGGSQPPKKSPGTVNIIAGRTRSRPKSGTAPFSVLDAGLPGFSSKTGSQGHIMTGSDEWPVSYWIKRDGTVVAMVLRDISYVHANYLTRN